MKIVIPEIPVSQARMKVTGTRRFARHYDPKAKEKKKIRLFLSQNFTQVEDFPYPRISFIFHMPIPKNIPKKYISLYSSGLMKHIKKPDVDNLVKLYLDCLDGIIIHQDSKVSLGFAIKLYNKIPSTQIWVEGTSCMIDPNEIFYQKYILEEQITSPLLPLINKSKWLSQ